MRFSHQMRDWKGFLTPSIFTKVLTGVTLMVQVPQSLRYLLEQGSF